MSDDERSSYDKLPRVLVFDGDAESYLDASASRGLCGLVAGGSRGG